MRALHLVVDIPLPMHMDRNAAFTADLSALPYAKPSPAALRWAAELCDQDSGGAAYVLHGAHRSGGRVIAPKMAKRGLPTAHVCYSEPERVSQWLEMARGTPQWAEQARETFRCLLMVMSEIR